MTRTIRLLVSVASVLAVLFHHPGSDMHALATPAAADYTVVPDWLRLPQGRDQLGNMHGDVAVSSTGDVYVSVQDPQAGLQVYAPDGRFLRNVPDAPADLHGFVIRRQPDGEFIFGPTLRGQTIVKMTLEGKVVMTIPASAIPDEFKVRNARSGQLGVLLTGMDVAPNGDLYVTDGYASDYIHRFDKAGKYLNSFGGKKEPYNFSTLHKLAIDTRFQPARIIACDRANNRVVHLSLYGDSDRSRRQGSAAAGGRHDIRRLCHCWGIEGPGHDSRQNRPGGDQARNQHRAGSRRQPAQARAMAVRASWSHRTASRQRSRRLCSSPNSTCSAGFIGSTGSRHQSGTYSGQRRQTSERRRPQWQRNSGYSQAWPWSWLAAAAPKRRPASCRTPEGAGHGELDSGPGTGMNAFFGQALIAGAKSGHGGTSPASPARSTTSSGRRKTTSASPNRPSAGNSRTRRSMATKRGTLDPRSCSQLAAAEGRQLHIWLTPHGFVKGALAAGNATLTEAGGTNVISYTALDKYKLVGTLDAQNLVTKVETKVANPVLGDTDLVATYLGLQGFQRREVSTKILIAQGGFPIWDLAISNVTPNAPLDLAVLHRRQRHGSTRANGQHENR